MDLTLAKRGNHQIEFLMIYEQLFHKHSLHIFYS